MRAWLVVMAACGGGGGGTGVIRISPNTMSAAFTESGDGCEVHAYGSCSVRVPCDGMPAQLDAGTLQVVDGPIGLAFDETHGGYGAVQIADGIFFNPGDSVVVDASGADVPAFSLGVVAPSASVPGLPGNTILRDRDFAITWDGGDGLIGFQINTGSHRLHCSFLASAGTALVPADALAQLPTSNSAQVAFANASTNEVTVGDWSVTLIASITTLQGAVALK